MFLEQRPTVTQQQTITISPKMIASLKMLVLSSLELAQRVNEERDENPAIEVEELTLCAQCGMPLTGRGGPLCSAIGVPSRDGGSDWADLYEHGPQMGGDDDEFDPMLRVSATATLDDVLMSALSTMLPSEDTHIAEALVGNLDERGYLTVSVAELAQQLDVTEDRVEAALAALQTQEPVGIGARDLTECLLLQLRWFREQGQPQPLAEQIVAHHLTDVGQRRFVEIGRELGTTSTHVKRAWNFIKANLNPYPAHSALAESHERNQRGTTALIRPDVIIRRTDSGFEAEVVERGRYRLGINPTFQMVTATKDHGGVSDAQRQEVTRYVKRAQLFIDNVQQRWQTLKKITDALIEVQYEFLDKGVRYLIPLTRSELATRVGLHEATISRATNDKYVMLPDGRTISFDDFFDGSLRAKDILREIIANEDPHRPFSDEDLAAMLHRRGVSVARRTVAKYREAMRILPSRYR